ncbi:Asp23/Gls24 family envelope stress response protein [Lactobacillus sp. DCY120]|uniref:Stress response regulator gls24 homolog n=1 Tax=Bombilactobacillus apium TaxID=2675299 RepID=A0A850R759_9LACO|nr:Asp23/Gls24 family envelope stress response protein [Bombilactobacillus apium]NVY96677.1 Asp23/Gls24 family envelope stress response protein [Bombilactobacillus apium]
MALERNSKQNSEVQKIKGELTYEDRVLQKIIGIALSHIDGLLTVDGGFFSNLTDKIVNNDDVTDGVDVEVGKKQVAVDIDIIAEYGTDISKLYDDIKEKISSKVKAMTNLEVVEVNVNVSDIKTKKEHEKDSVSLQDRLTGNNDEEDQKKEKKEKKANSQPDRVH